MAARVMETRRSPDEFDVWMDLIRERASRTAGPFFLVEPEVPLFDVYLDAFEALAPKQRQVHNCSCCRHFLRRYGGAVTVAESGELLPVFWAISDDDAHDVYGGVEHALALAVRAAPIRAVLIDSAEEWGNRATGAWSHFGVPSLARWKHVRKAAHEEAAEKREERGMLARALEEFPAALVKQARALLEAEQLYRSEKVLGVATWFDQLHARLAGLENQRRRDSLLWLAAATAPVGSAHVRSTMIGTLLEDLAQGLPIDTVRERFAAKMHPLQYQRPTAAPTDGQIARAEKVMAELGAAGSLERRFAKLEDLQTAWRPRDAAPARPAVGGMFDHLRPGRSSGAVDLGAPPAAITWVKFASTVLLRAERMELLLPERGASYSALVTAADPSAPPIIQWDRPERRNPVTWYLYNGGSSPDQWNLPSRGWHPITAIALSPSQWDPERPMDHHGKGVHLILEGCRDLRHGFAGGGGGGLFPEFLKSELREVRHTLEAHFLRAPIARRDEATASGLRLAGNNWGAVVRVTSEGVKTSYRLDRWD